MSYGIQAYVDDVEVISTGDNPCRYIKLVGKYSSAGTFYIPLERAGGNILWTPYSLYSDPMLFQENNTQYIITNVESYSAGLKITVESDYHNISYCTLRAQVFEWD